MRFSSAVILIVGCRYFHRAGKSSALAISNDLPPTEAGGFRGGTRKGLDLTFGSPITSNFSPKPSSASSPIRGGILFRTIQSTESGNSAIVSGPSLIVDRILNLTRSRNIAELVNSKLGSLSALEVPVSDSNGSPRVARLYLTNSAGNDTPASLIVHQSPRIGLELSHPSVIPQAKNPWVSFIGKFYRYFIRPENLKSNGRCNTLVGLAAEAFPEGLSKGFSSCDVPIVPILEDRLQNFPGSKSATLKRYMEYFVEGFSNGSLARFVGPGGKGVASNPRKFMRMMGVLCRMGLLEAN